jgi:hypothetical protein
MCESVNLNILDGHCCQHESTTPKLIIGTDMALHSNKFVFFHLVKFILHPQMSETKM